MERATRDAATITLPDTICFRLFITISSHPGEGSFGGGEPARISSVVPRVSIPHWGRRRLYAERGEDNVNGVTREE
jgi:hypothetical protein